MQDISEKYKQIDILVDGYQQGNSASAEKLVEFFDPFLKKYLKIIKGGVISLSDKDSRKFVSLFMADAIARKGLQKSFQSTETRNKAYQAVVMITGMTKNIPDEDLEQELICILLLMAGRYKKRGKKINFCGYVYSSFKFEVYRMLSKLTMDPLVHGCDLALRFNDEAYIDEDNDVESDDAIYIEELMMILDEELGNSWVRGLTCGEEFEELTPIERLILRMKYQEGRTDIYIADRLQMHRNTVRTQRIKAIDKIKYKG